MNKTLFACFLALVSNLSMPAWANEANPVLAIVADFPITKQDLLNYGRESPYLLPYLSIPGGPMRILKDMVNERLLILEGERLGIVQGEKSNPAYAFQIRNYLTPPCPVPDPNTTRTYYDENPEKFSTPVFLRLYRFGLPFTAENETAVFGQLRDLRDRITRSETTLSAAVAEAEAEGKSESDAVRQGDLGFLPDDSPDNPTMKELIHAPVNQIVGPLKQKDWFFLYQVTDRREPILATYESVKVEAAKVQREACSQLKWNKLFNELRQRWPVKMLVDEIGVRPEAK